MKVGFPAVTDPHGAATDITVAIRNIRSRLEAIESNLLIPAAIRQQILALQTAVAALEAAASTSASTTTSTVTLRAGENILAGQAVYESTTGIVMVADATVQSRSFSVIGIAQTSAAAGGSLTVSISGQIAITPAVSLSAGYPVFVGSAGSLTQTPLSGFPALQVGMAVGATSVFVLPDQQLTTYEVQGLTVGFRRQVDFVAGANITIAGYDDPTNDRVVIIFGYNPNGPSQYYGH